ncbi:hypothetical protein AYI69_g5555 [Smittium culicis]|uniref:Uncharacterized protein n=1 Tax=Smittium culicis TaxID=133412 RepID=A0A1R1Y5E1_9FUNG|nr:hypothetical protein AYI69_g5555 [Smittium culicis]
MSSSDIPKLVHDNMHLRISELNELLATLRRSPPQAQNAPAPAPAAAAAAAADQDRTIRELRATIQKLEIQLLHLSAAYDAQSELIRNTR